MRTKCTRRIQFSKWPADIKISKVISTLRWAAQRGNEKENTYINACMCVYSRNLYVHWGNKYTRLPRNIWQSFLQLFSVPLPAPHSHSQYLANACDVFACLGTKRRMRNSTVASADAAAAVFAPTHEYLGK